MSRDGITFRRGTEADAHDAFNVFRLAMNEFYSRTGQPRVADQDDQSPGYVHMMRHDGERFWVAERRRKLVAFSAALVRDRWWFLSNLFVLPQVQSLGVGRELLGRAMTGRPQGGVMATITDAVQPVSNTLYARHGMLPWLPLVSYRASLAQLDLLRALGRRRPDTIGGLGDLRPEPLSEVGIPGLRDIDLDVLGFDRGVDHRHLIGTGSRRGWVYRRAGLAMAYAMYRTNGWIGPVACRDERDVGAVLRHILHEAAGERPPVLWTGVPSPNVAAQRTLLEAGFVYDAPPALLLASEPFGDFARYVPASFGMM